jgi:ABC-type transport system involved in multi-copper enzyme maturation permease subunit
MKWLFWKDFWHNRLVVFAGLFLLLLPYIMAVSIGCWERAMGAQRQISWESLFIGASIYSLILSQLSIALIGGNAIAGERIDRSADFLFSLPFDRSKLLTSKLLLALLIVAVIWLANAPLLLYMAAITLETTSAYSHQTRIADVLLAGANIALTGMTFFCVAWCLSSFLSSPTFAVCGGLITPLLVGTGSAIFEWELVRLEWLTPERYGLATTVFYDVACLILCPTCFVVGTRHYLRRAEP